MKRKWKWLLQSGNHFVQGLICDTELYNGIVLKISEALSVCQLLQFYSVGPEIY